MSFKLDEGLSPSPEYWEIADFWEVECMKKVDHSVSLLDLSKVIGIIDDVQETEADEKEAELEVELQDVITEIERRIKCSSGKYPFDLSSQNILSFNKPIENNEAWIYLYLLLATRNKMTKNKSVNGKDGTLIFEKLSKDTLTNYLGSNAKGLVFGTGASGGFHAKLTDLINELKECTLHPPGGLTYNPQDDKVDVVAWIPFYDDQPSKLICFAQCKTGTSWISTTEQLNISSFLKRWFSLDPALDPIKAFMIADVLNKADFRSRSLGNLFFDRFRMLSFSKVNSGNDWFDDLKQWTQGILTKYKLSF